MNKKFLYTLVFISLIILAGFLRETFFVRIKWCEAVASGKAFAPESHWLFSFLEWLNLGQLQIAKYIGTLIFVLIFWLESLLMVRLYFKNSFNFKLIHILFLFPFCLGIFIYACSLFLPYQEFFYAISRWIIGLIETPLIIIILFPLLWVQTKSSSIKKG